MKPEKQVLERLYLNERKSTRDIADHFGVSHMSIKRWLRSYGIAARPTGRGLANRGVEPPGYEMLYHLVHVQHKGYAEIGRMYGVSEIAVGKWLDKHQIPRAAIWETRRKGVRFTLPTEDELRQMYIEQGMTLEEIATMHKVNRSTIATLCRKVGISLRPDGFNGGIRFTCEDGHLVRSTYERRVDNWLHEHKIAHEYEPVLPCDRRYHADFLVNGWYIEIWGVNSSKEYAQRKSRKISLYRAHQIPLIQLSINSFSNRRKDSWMKRLAPCLDSYVHPAL
jgi:TyrR family helix-turn-helix protein